MALDYDTPIKFEKLAPVLEEYADWFGQIALKIAYHDDPKTSASLTTPQSFQDWLNEVEFNQSVNPNLIKDMSKIYEDMLRLAQGLMKSVADQKKPSRTDFEEFKAVYDSFLSRIRRLEKDNGLDGGGVDEQTGLRHYKFAAKDLKREMERLSRQGNPFSMVMTRIDNYAGQVEQDQAINIAVYNIKECVRSFDDAYHLGDGQFLLSLKHADMIGAQAAVTRLQSYLKRDENNQSLEITMSYCMAEPVEGDEIANLIKNMQEDLIAHLDDKDAVLKMVEMSELERYVNKM